MTTESKFDLEKRAALLLQPGSRALACALAREAVAAERAEWEAEGKTLVSYSIEAIEAAKRKAADERAEEIAREFEGRHHETLTVWRSEAAAIARSTITPPEAREQRLERALRDLLDAADFQAEKAKPGDEWVGPQVRAAAREALKETDR